MATTAEELQAKEFLKRAEVRTMKKDLSVLREADAMKERNKIVGIKTLEEQMEEKKKAEIDIPVKAVAERAKREEVLQRNEGQERIAEKDLKNYAAEEERQQIFLLESQRLSLEKQADAIDKEKDPALKLEKNKKRTRVSVKFGGIKVTSSGEYNFKLSIKNKDGKFEEIISAPLDIKLTNQPVLK